MGLIAGLIGVSIVANAISETVVGQQREKEQARIQAERIRAEKEIKTAKIHSKALVKMAKINAQAEVAQTGMKTGFFSSLFGLNNEQRILDGGNTGWAPVAQESYVPQSTSSYIPQSSTYLPGDTGSYTDRTGAVSGTARPMFCRYCGTKHDADAMFCVSCGRSLG